MDQLGQVIKCNNRQTFRKSSLQLSIIQISRIQQEFQVPQLKRLPILSIRKVQVLSQVIVATVIAPIIIRLT